MDIKDIIDKINNLDKDKGDLIKTLSELPKNQFELVKKLFYKQKIKICEMPLISDMNFFNLNHIKAMNTIQLKYIFSYIMQELKTREDK